VALRSRVPDVEIVVAGRDPQNPDGSSVLWVEAKELGIGDGLRTLPRVHLHDLPALYASCQVAIAPLVGPEPGGLFVLQAMAAGLPVVASPNGAHSDLIGHGEEGLLLPVDDLGSFVGGIASLLLDKVGRPVFGQAARLRAMEQHDSERSFAALEALYERIRSGSQSSAAA
jgi:glycosyltransferase involved in cell wall biosynthesis